MVWGAIAGGLASGLISGLLGGAGSSEGGTNVIPASAQARTAATDAQYKSWLANAMIQQMFGNYTGEWGHMGETGTTGNAVDMSFAEPTGQFAPVNLQFGDFQMPVARARNIAAYTPLLQALTGQIGSMIPLGAGQQIVQQQPQAGWGAAVAPSLAYTAGQIPWQQIFQGTSNPFAGATAGGSGGGSISGALGF